MSPAMIQINGLSAQDSSCCCGKMAWHPQSVQLHPPGSVGGPGVCADGLEWISQVAPYRYICFRLQVAALVAGMEAVRAGSSRFQFHNRTFESLLEAMLRNSHLAPEVLTCFSSKYLPHADVRYSLYPTYPAKLNECKCRHWELPEHPVIPPRQALTRCVITGLSKTAH